MIKDTYKILYNKNDEHEMKVWWDSNLRIMKKEWATLYTELSMLTIVFKIAKPDFWICHPNVLISIFTNKQM